MNRALTIALASAIAFAGACTNLPESNAAFANATPTNSMGAQGGGQASTPAATPTPRPSAAASPEGEQPKGPADVIYEYYASINSKDFRSAYELWSDKGAASKKTFEQFRDGFKNTERTEVIIGAVGEEEGAAGSRYITIPVTVKARTTDGKDQTFKGEYVLRRSVVDGATDEQKTWHIYSAKLTAVRN